MFTQLITIARWEVGAFLCAVAALLLFRMLTGRISMRGLFTDENGRTHTNGVQLLFFTLLGAGWYLMEVMQKGMLPPVPNELLALVGASHGVFNAFEMRRGRSS